MHPDLPRNLIPSLATNQPKKGWYVAYEGTTVRPVGSGAVVEPVKAARAGVRTGPIDLTLRKEKYVYL